ncbi:MAG: hypothetical protein EAZ91_07775 [Cytophagales bacterium]|nr:MAG: hypothetical protein EAZ91_07775 [Cytophagales bacterium]
MKASSIKQLLMALMLGLVFMSCGPRYYRYGYNDRPYGYYRPAPRVIVVAPPRVYHRNQYRYRPTPPAYGRRYNQPQGNAYGRRNEGNGRSRGNGRYR